MTSLQEICTAIGLPANDPHYVETIQTQNRLWQDPKNSWAFVPVSSVLGKTLVQISSGREAERRAHEIVLAFFGPAFASSGNKNSVVLPTGVEVYVNSFVVSNDEWDTKLAILNELTKARLFTKPIERAVSKPLDTLLGDFYLALTAGNDSLAQEKLKLIELSGALRGDNLQFLDIHRLAVFEEWGKIAALVSFEDFTRVRRPRQISSYLLRTLWQRDFGAITNLDDYDVIRQSFLDLDFTKRYRDLLGSLTKSNYLEVRILLSMFFGEISDAVRFTELCNGLEQSEIERLSELTGLKPIGDFSEPVEDSKVPNQLNDSGDIQCHPAMELMEVSDFEGVITFAEAHPSDSEAIGLGIQAAIELTDPLSAKRIVEIIDRGLCEVQNVQILRNQVAHLRSISANYCSGWLEWANRSSVSNWPNCFQVVSEGFGEWGIEWCDDFNAVKTFSTDLENAFSGLNGAQVRQSLAFILDLVSENSDRGAISEVRSAALNILVNLEMSSAQIRNAFVSLIASYETGNISTENYVDLVDATSLMWGAYGSVSFFPWILDVIEQLMRLPKLDEQKIQAFVYQVHSSMLSFGKSIDLSLHNLFGHLVSSILIIELRTLEAEVASEDKWNKFEGKKIGIYSLLESLPDLKGYLEEICPKTSFEINQNKVATDELRAMASNSDLVLIQTSKSKHAATEELNRFITGERIYVAGRGRGSIINALLNWNPK